MTKSVNLFVLDGANIYVLNTRILSASIALSFILLLFLFLFVFICKCVQGLCYYLRLFGSVFEVCVGIPVHLQLVWWFVKIIFV